MEDTHLVTTPFNHRLRVSSLGVIQSLFRILLPYLLYTSTDDNVAADPSAKVVRAATEGGNAWN